MSPNPGAGEVYVHNLTTDSLSCHQATKDIPGTAYLSARRHKIILPCFNWLCEKRRPPMKPPGTTLGTARRHFEPDSRQEKGKKWKAKETTRTRRYQSLLIL